MQYSAGSFTVATTGNRTIVGLGFRPIGLRLMIGERVGTTENANARWGTGFTDGTDQCAVATVANGNGFWTRNYDQYCIVALTTPSASINRSLSGSFVSFNSDGFTLNFDKCDESFKVFVEAFGDDLL